jgi:hypothetical protein
MTSSMYIMVHVYALRFPEGNKPFAGLWPASGLGMCVDNGLPTKTARMAGFGRMVCSDLFATLKT